MLTDSFVQTSLAFAACDANFAKTGRTDSAVIVNLQQLMESMALCKDFSLSRKVCGLPTNRGCSNTDYFHHESVKSFQIIWAWKKALLWVLPRCDLPLVNNYGRLNLRLWPWWLFTVWPRWDTMVIWPSLELDPFDFFKVDFLSRWLFQLINAVFCFFLFFFNRTVAVAKALGARRILAIDMQP